jgi:hypothetical protein
MRPAVLTAALLALAAAFSAAGPAPAASPGHGPSAAAALRCPVSASFSPTRGDPTRLRVRFHVAGFRGRKPVYLHYLNPSRHLARTVGLGFTSGVCGLLTSSRRRLFPFRDVRAGTWRLQFDTQGRFHRRPRAPFVILRVPVVPG